MRHCTVENAHTMCATTYSNRDSVHSQAKRPLSRFHCGCAVASDVVATSPLVEVAVLASCISKCRGE